MDFASMETSFIGQTNKREMTTPECASFESYQFHHDPQNISRSSAKVEFWIHLHNDRVDLRVLISHEKRKLRKYVFQVASHLARPGKGLWTLFLFKRNVSSKISYHFMRKNGDHIDRGIDQPPLWGTKCLDTCWRCSRRDGPGRGWGHERVLH